MPGPFDVVNQYDALRQSLIAPPPPPMPEAPPKIQPGAAGHFEGDGHDHSSPSPAVNGGARLTPSGKLVAFKGYKYDSSVMPKLQALASKFPNLRFTSGYRDTAHNARVGGVKNSWHLKGTAADLSGSAADMQAAEAWARANGAREAMRHNVKTGYHLHVAW